ncbi:ATP-binding protein [Phaeobacter gallaeciensis]|uniref:histidine kinase n=1 Tax=Phaeobacter gallaeciensis TaxID=60890 RepID=A0AAC9Z9D4_9RHOB|nr:ATP-binding protein [Phaeobacter gallaeciensis]AHD09848.1 Signal transduction histidine kinase [Phaeobacter gallaeciensis DSM 26640]ATE93112.1 sensor histidine kinase [Phaeobacter gallaeciensis]ATE97066.1 sensor histidine kinase [Phaeobacter gallaeciensis]ATF01777.1 sensor histidine kinase [Phaeobacter gallaeciensis]ATF06157.1 sensor histidine kinase [Phaeobacter gallaeciensis]
MFFQWLKHYMPRSLYGRAALILLVPIVTLQLVVSVVFIKRDLEDLTVQMTLTMLRELRLLEQTMAPAASQQEALLLAEPLLQPLQMQIRFLEPEEPVPLDQMGLLEFSGRVVRNTLQATAPQFISAQFPNTRRVQLVLASDHGPMALVFDRRRVTAAAPHQLIVTVIAFGFLMTIIAFVYMRNQLRPIKQLADAAQAFGRGRTEPYSPRGANEVRAAGSAFLDMRARIERQMEQRTLMLSGVSHDLRTPLTRMKLGLSMLDDEEAEPLRQDVDEMQALLDAFLDFSRGVSTSEPEEVDPYVMITLLVDGWRRQGKDVMLGEMSGKGKVMLRGSAIRRAVQNLISNAVRYGTRARVSVAMTEKFLRIRVEDDGPGIAEADRTEATRPFTRLDPARNQDLGSGVGLGLAIVTDIARAHGGTLRLEQSAALGGLQADIVIGL